MSSDDDLRLRETARRKALWALADLTPGDPRANSILRVLDDLQRQELAYPVLPQTLTADEVLRLVPAQPHPIGMSIVRDEDIPQPWLERFKCASRGSTRVAEGAYWDDWHKFLSEWQMEMAHVERHKSLARMH